MNTIATNGVKKGLPILDIDAELKKFEEEERKRLGLDTKTEQWIEDMANLTFTKTEKSTITLLIGGLTIAHDYFIEAALRGIDYNVQMLDCPTNAALQVGMETINALEGSFGSAAPLFKAGQFRSDLRGFLLEAFSLLTHQGKLGLQLVEAGLGLRMF